MLSFLHHSPNARLPNLQYPRAFPPSSTSRLEHLDVPPPFPVGARIFWSIRVVPLTGLPFQRLAFAFCVYSLFNRAGTLTQTPREAYDWEKRATAPGRLCPKGGEGGTENVKKETRKAEAKQSKGRQPT